MGKNISELRYACWYPACSAGRSPAPAVDKIIIAIKSIILRAFVLHKIKMYCISYVTAYNVTFTDLLSTIAATVSVVFDVLCF